MAWAARAAASNKQHWRRRRGDDWAREEEEEDQRGHDNILARYIQRHQKGVFVPCEILAFGNLRLKHLMMMHGWLRLHECMEMT